MANCKDNCIHYRVCMYGDLTEYKTEQVLKDDCDDYMSNDVVPKSEVKEAVEKLMSATDKVICEAKQEVAREIFEEIDRIALEYCDRFIPPAEMVAMLFDVKKKYTESEDK